MLFNKNKINKLPKQSVDIDKELDAVMLFLTEVGSDLKEIYIQCKKMKELRKRKLNLEERKVPDIAVNFNLGEQIKVWDQMLKTYQFFDDDVEINKKRVQMVGDELKKLSLHTNMPEELKNKIKNSEWWNFKW